MRVLVGLSMVASFAACAGPQDGPDGTYGTEHRVTFSYRRGCFFGCPIRQPLLAGSQQTVNVSGPGDDADVRVESSDPDVAELSLTSQCFCDQAGSDSAIEIASDASCRSGEKKRCENGVEVQAHDPGDVLLELYGGDGDLIDWIRLEVREADRAQFSITLPGAPGPTKTEDFELRVGDKAQVEVELYDGEGRELLAPVGVHWSVGDAAIATVTGFLNAGGAMLDDGLGVDLNGVAAGETVLAVSVPGLDDSAGVSVTDAP